MNIFNTKKLFALCASTILLFITAGSSTALAKKAVFKIAVDGGKGGMIRLTKKKITYTCKASQGCDAPSVNDLGTYLAETIPDPDFEVGGYAVKDLLDRPIETLTTFNVAILRKYKNQDVKLVVIFRKKPFPIKVSVADGVGGTVVGENNVQCSTSSECTFPGFGVDDLVNLTANPADGWELEKWSISDLINTGLNKDFKDLKLIRIKQTRTGFRITVKFRKKLLPVLASVFNGVGGSILASDGRTCATAKPCMMTPKKLDEKIDLTAVESPGFSVTKWIVYNDDNSTTVFTGVKKISIPQMKKGVRILVQFGDSSDSTCAIPPGYSPIYNADDLAKLRSIPTGSKNYFLCANIDLTGVAWVPIYLRGTFDGNNHVISNLTTDRGGFFNPLSDSVVKNLGLTNVNVTDGYHWTNNDYYAVTEAQLQAGYVEFLKFMDARFIPAAMTKHTSGGLAPSMLNTSIANTYVTGKITSTCHVGFQCIAGGLVGYATSGYTGMPSATKPYSVVNSYFSGDVSVSVAREYPHPYLITNTSLIAGGLIGEAISVALQGANAHGSVKIDNQADCSAIGGGLVGAATAGKEYNGQPAGIEKSYATATVSANVSECYSGNPSVGNDGTFYKLVGGTLQPSAKPNPFFSLMLGGFVGLAQQSIGNSYSTGNVSFVSKSNSSWGRASGFIGHFKGVPYTIRNSYSTSAAAGSAALGTALTSPFFSICQDVSAQCNGVSPNNIVTFNGGSKTTTSYVTNNYTQSTAATPPIDPNGLFKSLTPTAMQQQGSFVGWDFVNTWKIPTGGGYPELR